MGSCQGRPEGAFILTLDSSLRHFMIEPGTKRNAVQLQLRSLVDSVFALFLSGLLVASRLPHRSGILHHHLFVSVTEHSGFASNQVLWETLADATPPLPCFYPHSEWAT